MAALIAVVVAQVATAGDSKVYDSKDTKNLTAGEKFEEYATGWNVEVFGGATPFQTGTFRAGTPAGTANLHTDDRINGVAGAKVGYVWNPGWHLADVPVLPSLDLEGFWTGYQAGSQFKASGGVAGGPAEFMTNQDIYVVSVDPTVKFQLGRFRPYVGVGVGAAYLTADGGHVAAGGASTALAGSSNDFAFALQGLAGLETFINKNWSIDIGYKYLSLLNPTFGSQYAGGVPVNTAFPNWYGQHIVTAGIKFYF
ncbi:MAG: outer membrane beta-barrel protein [Verrucomicrobium sp.]|nr:outer membrane beta-barrel protein [Verrucomicrobium sp.]